MPSSYFGRYFDQVIIGPPDGSVPVPPVIRPSPDAAGRHQFAYLVTLTLSSPDNSTILYTLDGSVPRTAASANVFGYSQPVKITRNTVVTAVAVANGLSSDVARCTLLRRDP